MGGTTLWSPYYSHLEGDASNVALFVPEVKRATWAGLVGALTLWITGPFGGLSTPVREDDSSGRGRPVEIRHSSRNTVDIVDRCRVCESHADTGAQRIVKPARERALPVYTADELVCLPADRVVAAVTAPPVEPAEISYSSAGDQVTASPDSLVLLDCRLCSFVPKLLKESRCIVKNRRLDRCAGLYLILGMDGVQRLYTLPEAR